MREKTELLSLSFVKLQILFNQIKLKEMRKSYLPFLTRSIGILLIAILFLPSCEETTEDPPEFPPVSSMLMDFSDFSNNNKSEFLPGTLLKSEETALHWFNAAAHVAVWNIIISVGLAVPVGAFIESFNHEGVFQGDKTWIWSYNLTVAGAIYKADLHGQLMDDKVRWEMYITQTDVYSDFMWYYGEVKLDQTEGFWMMYEKPANPSELLRIDWTKDSDNATAEIKYTNVQPNGPENGGYIQYGIIADSDYDRFYDIFAAGDNKLVNIKWNTVTKEGRVRNPVAFHDDNWRCWDTDLQDIDCN